MKAQPLTVYLPDTHSVSLGRFGCGNLKIGAGVFTYSRLAGAAATCPGATAECEAICYAKRIDGVVRAVYARNSEDEHAPVTIPTLPEHTKLLRIHISGDFDTIAYVHAWTAQLRARPDVTAWAYTRSWRVPELLPALEALRALPNMQLFASMDPSTTELPPCTPPCTCPGVLAAEASARPDLDHTVICFKRQQAWVPWRRAWIWRAAPNGPWPVETRLDAYRKPIYVGAENGDATFRLSELNMRCNIEGTPAYVCPEETGRKRDCVSCGYCFEGQKHDVVFLEHHGA